MPDLVKPFSKHSLDNPALLAQFAHTLTAQYREMFPATRGFTVELRERGPSRFPSRVRQSDRMGWQIRILHGTFGGTLVFLKYCNSVPEQVHITSEQTCRLYPALVWILAVPTLLASQIVVFSLFAASWMAQPDPLKFIFVILIRVCSFVIAIIVLRILVGLLNRVFAQLDDRFDKHTRRHIIALAERLPLPSTLEYPLSPPMNAGQFQVLPPPLPGTWQPVPPPPRPEPPPANTTPSGSRQ